MTPVDVIAGMLALMLLLWFLERRQRAQYAQELSKLGMAKNRADELIQQLNDLTNKTVALELLVEQGEDRRNSALKTFLESFADLIKINEDQKKHLQNKLQAKKMDK